MAHAKIKWLPLLLSFLILTVTLPFPASAEALSVSAESAVLIEAESGEVLWQKDAFRQMPMASTTKIMTALVAYKALPLDTKIAVPTAAVGIEGSSVYLHEGEILTLEELLYALLLESANDAAVAIALAVAGDISSFAEKMNAEADNLGLQSTHFDNPHGLDSETHYTTAYDLARIAAAAVSFPELRAIFSTSVKKIPLDGSGVRYLRNHNRLLRSYDGAIGIKTGFTKRSGRCLVSAAERDGMTLIAVTLKAPDDWNDHKALLDFGFEAYERVVLATPGSLSHTFPVVGGTDREVVLANDKPLSLLLKKGHGKIGLRIEARRFFFAPVKEGAELGRAVFSLDGADIATLPLYAVATVRMQEPKGIFEKIKAFFIRYL